MDRDQGDSRFRGEGWDVRTKPRPHPTVKLNRRCHSFGRYDQVKNVIEFGCRCETEAEAVSTLIHEVQHWTSWMFLTPKEMHSENMPDANKDYDGYACWIPEYISIAVEHLVCG